jgi:hypothetical protein
MTGIYYLLAFNPSKGPFQHTQKEIFANPDQSWRVNSVDRYIVDRMTPLRHWLARMLGMNTSHSSYREKLEHALNKVRTYS